MNIMDRRQSPDCVALAGHAQDQSRQVLSVVSGVRRRRAAGEQDEADRRGIPDTTTCTKPLERTYGDWFPSS
jgi:hypothetical protein